MKQAKGMVAKFLGEVIGAGLLMPVATLAAVDVGMTEDAVVTELGEPNGRAEVGGKVILHYFEGEVWLDEGVVTRADIVSTEQAIEREAKRKAWLEEQRKRQQERRIEEVEAAIKMVDNKKTDPDFITRPLAYQLSYWRSMQAYYPELDLGAEIEDTAARLEKQVDKFADDRVITALTERAARAEERAAAAEERAHEARFRNSWVGYHPVFLPARRQVIVSDDGSVVSVSGGGGSSQPVVIVRPQGRSNIPPPNTTIGGGSLKSGATPGLSIPIKHLSPKTNVQ